MVKVHEIYSVCMCVCACLCVYVCVHACVCVYVFIVIQVLEGWYSAVFLLGTFFQLASVIRYATSYFCNQ